MQRVVVASVLVAAFAVLVPCACFDTNSLIPDVGELESSLAEMVASLRSTSGAQAGHIYHEVLAANELLRKMVDQLQADQASDRQSTMAAHTRLLADIAKLEASLAKFKEGRKEGVDKLEALQAQHDALSEIVGKMQSSLDDKTVQITTTTTECRELKSQHDTRLTSATSDAASISKIITTLRDVECSQLTSFIQGLALPTSVSLLEVDTQYCDCALPDCNCADTPPSEESEVSCETRKENVRALLQALLEQVYSASEQESQAFGVSYKACTDDLAAQDAAAAKLSANLTAGQRELEGVEGQLPDARSKVAAADQAVSATSDEISAMYRKRKEVHDNFVMRSNLRKEQGELLNRILALLAELTESSYAPVHLDLADGCPNLCSSHGICYDGKCECEAGWTFADCGTKEEARVCPFNADSGVCTDAACAFADFTRLSSESPCSDVVCAHCRLHAATDNGCVFSPTAMFCAERDRAQGCSSVECASTEPVCGLRRVVRKPFTGCCFNPLLDCEDKCTAVACPAVEPQCPAGKAVRYPFRDCCFNNVTDCVDECALAKCSEQEPVCPVGKEVRRPFSGCCFNATMDCEDECTFVVCPNDELPTDACRARGQRWTGSTVGCCFDADVDCARGDDAHQENERAALVALFNTTQGQYWYRADGWNTDSWVCFWSGVECSGPPGDMHVTSLTLHANGLTGILTAELVHLKHLEFLDLSENFIGGEIPAELASLQSLQSLKLRRNALIGSVPSGLSKLPSLQLIDLGYNFLTGALPEFDDNQTLTCAHNCMCNGDCTPLRTANDQYNTAAQTCAPCPE